VRAARKARAAFARHAARGRLGREVWRQARSLQRRAASHRRETAEIRRAQRCRALGVGAVRVEVDANDRPEQALAEEHSGPGVTFVFALLGLRADAVARDLGARGMQG
jgi:hypothetical protein